RKVTAQRAENNQKNYKKDNFYIISIEIVFFHLSRYFMSRTLFTSLRTFSSKLLFVRNSKIKDIISNRIK
ncbi:hypothetical protein, partial [Staphylococcus epidermidis]|uniref:hypothetical protein n=1 Tax=Staphylococcus epidermidis TaxID=1282 RepID=UPI001F43F785